jgi:hypothetical protein
MIWGSMPWSRRRRGCDSRCPRTTIGAWQPRCGTWRHVLSVCLAAACLNLSDLLGGCFRHLERHVLLVGPSAGCLSVHLSLRLLPVHVSFACPPAQSSVAHSIQNRLSMRALAQAHADVLGMGGVQLRMAPLEDVFLGIIGEGDEAADRLKT